MDKDEQIKELQTRNSELINELRGWKVRAEASREYLHLALVKLPLAMMVAMTPQYRDEMAAVLRDIEKLSRQHDCVLRDAWSGAHSLVVEFVKHAKVSGRHTTTSQAEDLEDWHGRFEHFLEST